VLCAGWAHKLERHRMARVMRPAIAYAAAGRLRRREFIPGVTSTNISALIPLSHIGGREVIFREKYSSTHGV